MLGCGRRCIRQVNFTVVANPCLHGNEFRDVTWNCAFQYCTVAAYDVLRHYFRLVGLRHDCVCKRAYAILFIKEKKVKLWQFEKHKSCVIMFIESVRTRRSRCAAVISPHTCVMDEGDENWVFDNFAWNWGCELEEKLSQSQIRWEIP